MRDKKKPESITETIELPGRVEARIEKGRVTIKGEKGEISKLLLSKKVSIKCENNQINLVSNKNTKREKKLVGSFKAHIKNMIRGATEGYEYRMRVCAGHFPMSVSTEKDELVVKNFIGEKRPRRTRILEGVEIKIEGDEIILTGVNKEVVAQMSANIEQLTRRTGFDKRRFQDGIYITSKAGKIVK